MKIWDSFFLAAKSLKSHKMRSALTTLGIIIGIAAVIIVTALGRGGTVLISKEFEKLGSNLFSIFIDWKTDKPRKIEDMTFADVDVIKKLVPEITHLTAISHSGGNVKGIKDQKYVRLIGTTEDYAAMHNIKLRAGRFLNSEDIRGKRRVVIIEDRLAQEVLGDENILGKNIYINNVPAVVVGIIKTEEETLFNGHGPRIRTAFISFDFLKNITNIRVIHSIQGKSITSESVDISMGKALKILERRHNKTSGFYKAISLEKEMESAKRSINVVTLIIATIAGISLVVGGIGVMNIMLVSVTERTREIGIRKALGATHKDILIQFVFEAVMICLIGGFFGIIIGLAGILIITRLVQIPPIIYWQSILESFIFSVGIGLFFGIYPANKAAQLEAMDALRHE